MDYHKSGLFLQSRRKELSLTQRELAETIGVSDKTISKWECGKGIPDLEMLSELCKCLKITVNDYVSGEIVASGSYSMTAEENMMKLLVENKTKEKKGFWIQIICGLLLFIMGILLFLVTNFGFTWNEAAWFLDPMMFCIEIICLVAGVLISGNFAKGMDSILAFCRKAIIPLGAFLTVFQIANVLSWSVNAISAYSTIAIGCLPLLYALGIYIILLFNYSRNQNEK